MNARKRFPFPHTQLDVFTVAVRMVKQANAVAQAIPRGHRKIAGLCDLLGEPPQQAVFDGGFSSIDNVAQIKRRGVTDVVFTKHQGIEVGDMARSAWVFKRLRRFRAGVDTHGRRSSRRICSRGRDINSRPDPQTDAPQSPYTTCVARSSAISSRR